MIWLLQGTDTQATIARDALARCTFPFDVLSPGLHTQTGRQQIPVEWADLSRYTTMLTDAKASGGHLHVHENGDTAHPVERRERVLGLAWYSGRVTLERTLESEPELAAEVLLAEGAHMVDFFWMDDAHRTAVWNAVHPQHHDLPAGADVTDAVDLGHGHSWFDVGDYATWVGETFMEVFVRAYSDVPVTISLAHPVTDAAAAEARHALTPYFGVDGSNVYHDAHGGIDVDHYYTQAPADRRPCGVCKP